MFSPNIITIIIISISSSDWTYFPAVQFPFTIVVYIFLQVAENFVPLLCTLLPVTEPNNVKAHFLNVYFSHDVSFIYT